MSSRSKKVAVTGARGLLGTEVVVAAAQSGFEVLAWGRDALDVTDANACREALERARPDWVIHCAAYTAVDRAEEEVDEAMRTNGDATGFVAAACAGVGARLAYVSSDYVFAGTASTPYRTDATVGPTSVYGRSKLAGEDAASAHLGEAALIVRTGWLYGAHGRDFVDAMLRLADEGREIQVVDDQTGRPTWAANVARVLIELVERDSAGTFHVADGGTATWLDFATEIFRLAGVRPRLSGVSTESWGAPAPRPAYSVLSLEGTEEVLGRSMQPWPEAVASYLDTRRTADADRSDARSGAGIP